MSTSHAGGPPTSLLTSIRSMGDCIPFTHYRDINRGATLEQERDFILEEVRESDARRDYDKAIDLRTQYNELTERLLDLQLGPLTDPIEALPRELWVMILKEAISEYGDKIDGVLALTLVSVSWRRVLTTVPDLWTHITIEDRPSEYNMDVLAKLETALTLSTDLYIHLDIHQSTSYWEAALSHILPHKGRITAIRLHNDVRPGSLALFNANRDIKSLGYMPKLQSLHIHGRRLNLRSVIDESMLPGLVEVVGFELMEQHATKLFNMRNCKTNTRLPNLVQHLPSFPHLRTLIVLGPERAERAVIAKQVKSNAGKLEVPPLALQYLLYHQNEANIPLALRVIRSSTSLRRINMEFGMKWDQLIGLLSITSQLPQLLELRLYLYIPYSKFVFPSLGITTGVQILSLTIKSTVTQSSPEQSGVIQQNLHSLFDCLRICLGQVQDLILNPSLDTGCFERRSRRDDPMLSPPQDSSVTSLGSEYINSLPRLRKLRTTYFSPVSTNIRITADLELLSINGDYTPIADMLWRTTSRGIKVLLCICASSYPNEKSLLTIIINPTIARTLRVLDWFSWLQIDSIANFSSLRKLVLQLYWKEPSSDFFVQLMLQPFSCPMLEHIELLDGYPEWDWLILMLERRNLLRGGQVSPIRVLVFSRILSPGIYKILVELLHRRYSIRPSNRDLSLDGVSDIYFDESITTCHNCCSSLNICRASVLGPRFAHLSFPITMRGHISTTADPPLEDDLRQWLDELPERQLRWKQLSAREHARPISCGIHHKPRLRVVLTEFTPLRR